MIETANPAGIEQGTATPTTLHLFRYKQPEQELFYNRTALTTQLNRNITGVDNSLQRLNEQKNDRLARLTQTANELTEQLTASFSSITCGIVYLEMRDEPELSKLSPKDFMNFFKLCLTINNRVDESSRALIERAGGQILYLKYLNTINSTQLPQYHIEILDQMVHNPPEWFEGNVTSWRKFVMMHSYFQLYLAYSARKKALQSNHETIRAEETSFTDDWYVPITVKGHIPDWLSENDNGTLPEKQIVENELTEDKEENKLIRAGLERVKKQGDYLIKSIEDKTQKATERLRQQATAASPSCEHFSDLILFGKVVDTETPNISIMRDLLDAAVKSYVDSDNILTNQEPIALFIESVFEHGKLMQSAQDPIDLRFISLFQAAFDSIKAQQEDGSRVEQFESLRTTNKKAHGALNYDLRPFLEFLSAGEISFLKDLLTESEGKPIEQFIWDLAGTLSSAMKGKRDQLKPGSLMNLRKLTTSFLRNHSGWAHEQIQESLSGKDQTATSFETYEQPISDVQNEMETAGQEIAQGNLAGWQIFYTDNRSLDQHHLKDVGGQTLDEREEALQELLIKEQHLPSVKLGSIIRAFDWLVTIPENVEQMRIKKDVAGETFRKLKRGKIRIFYNIDSQKKKLVFFLHQKQAWNYGF